MPVATTLALDGLLTREHRGWFSNRCVHLDDLAGRRRAGSVVNEGSRRLVESAGPGC